MNITLLKAEIITVH